MNDTFIKSPANYGKECCGRCWKELSGKHKAHAKRALTHFRRRDGKRHVLEGMAFVAEMEAQLRADMQNMLNDMCDDSDYDSCEDYDDGTMHDGVDYSYEQYSAREHEYMQRYEYDDYYGDEYYRDSDYDRGYNAGYKSAIDELREYALRNKAAS